MKAVIIKPQKKILITSTLFFPIYLLSKMGEFEENKKAKNDLEMEED